MVSPPEMTWVWVGLIAAAAVLGMLHALGASIRNELQVQDLKVRTARLRSQYRKRLEGAEQEEIVIVDEAPPEPGPQVARPAA